MEKTIKNDTFKWYVFINLWMGASTGSSMKTWRTSRPGEKLRLAVQRVSRPTRGQGRAPLCIRPPKTAARNQVRTDWHYRLRSLLWGESMRGSEPDTEESNPIWAQIQWEGIKRYHSVLVAGLLLGYLSRTFWYQEPGGYVPTRLTSTAYFLFKTAYFQWKL